MKTRGLKWTALVVSGGLMMQLASCAPLLIDLLVQQLSSVVISSLVGGLATQGTTP